MDIFEVGGVSLIFAFVAGLLSVASPCVLPLVPAYLGYLTGSALEGSGGGQTVATAGAGGAGGSVAIASAPARDNTPSPFLHSVAFVSGFSIIFILFGISLGLGRFSFELDDRGLRVDDPARRPPTISFDGLDDDPATWQFAQFEPTPHHAMAVAIRRGDAENLEIRLREVVPRLDDR